MYRNNTLFSSIFDIANNPFFLLNMSTINNVCKLRMITAIIFLCSIFLPACSQDAVIFDTYTLTSILEETLPIENRSINNQQDMEDLYDDLQIAEIHTVGDLKNLINTYLQEVLIIEKEICRQINENDDLSASVSTGTYAAELEDTELIKKGIYFTMPGLVRTMLDLSHERAEATEEEL